MPTSILFGPPGTGKTTAALQRIDEAIANGLDPRRISLTTFTRKAAAEAIDRFREKYPHLDESCFAHWGTLHKIAFKNSNTKRGMVMNTKHYQDLNKEIGGLYEFRNKYDDRTEHGSFEGGLGDTCLQIYGYARACRISYEDAWRQMQFESLRFGAITQPLDFDVVRYFIRCLEAFKAREGMVDFTDMIDRCRTSLPVDLFVLDEAQDCTPQQWAFARQLSRNAKDKLVAGDDDQSIFRWGGADSSPLYRIGGERIVLPISYRLPKAVYDLIIQLTALIKHRMPKVFRPREAEGEVRRLVDENELDLKSGGDYMLLARTNYLCQRFIDLCRHLGVVYWFGDKWSNQTDTVQAVLVYENMRQGHPVSRQQAELACKFTGGYLAKPSDNVKWTDILWPFNGTPDWMDGMRHLSVTDRQYIRNLRANGESLTKPGRIKISTIHAAKGGECENVAVLSEMGRRVESSYWADQDSELRVWYTAFSRAKERLFVIDPSNSATTLPIFH